jgi:hypothetical protein
MLRLFILGSQTPCTVSAETKFVVKIYPAVKPKKVPKVVSTELKGVASGKQMSRMKKESVDCPVVKAEVSFLVCFACPSFIRRVLGEVDCAGGDGPPREWLL